MCRTLKNFYFRLRDFFFTAKYHANERKKLGAIKKAKKYLLDNTQEQKTINKIGFYLYGKNHLAHLQPIFRHLPKDDFEIVVSGDHPIPEYLLNVDYKVKTDLKVLSTGEKYKVLVSLYMISPQWVQQSFTSNQEGHETTAYFFKKLACQNTRMVYSLGALPWNTSKVMAYYDQILVYGKYEEGLYTSAFDGKIKVSKVGYPKFDDYFNHPSRDLSCSTLLNPALPTIVWLPTKAPLSSIPKYWKAISELCDKYNVILKPHPQEDSSLLEELQESGIIIVQDSDSASYYKIADFVFCDYGGSAFGALYTDRPFLFLSPENPEQDKKNYCPKSPEVHLRNYFSTIEKPDSANLIKLLTNAKHWELDAEIRKKKFLEFFEPNRGESGKCAVQVLKHNLFEN